MRCVFLTKWSGLPSMAIKPRGKAEAAGDVRVRVRGIVVEIQVQRPHLAAIVGVTARIGYVPAGETGPDHK
jgi:hypothetical protein